MKRIKATTIIEGPEELLISKEANNPTTTDKIPDKIAMIIIFLGLLLMFLAIAAGINNKPVERYPAQMKQLNHVCATPLLLGLARRNLAAGTDLGRGMEGI